MAHKHWFNGWSSRKPDRKGRSRRPGVEILEGRIVPATVNWISPGSGNWDTAANWSSGSVPSGGDDVIINSASAATITIASGDTESVHSLTTAADDTLSITGGALGIAADSSLEGSLAMTGGSLTASGTGVTFTVTGSTAVSAASLFAGGGATLSLPGLTSYAGAVGQSTTLQASGPGSVLALPNLTSLTINDSGYSQTQVEALAGGTVDLPALPQIAGDPATLESDGTAGGRNKKVVHLPVDFVFVALGHWT